MSGNPAQLQDILSNATAALLVMDSEHRCTYMNPAAEQLTGYTLGELEGRSLHDAIHHTRRDGAPLSMEECPIGSAVLEHRQARGEEVFIHKDGRFYDVAYAATAINEGEAVVGTVLELHDISEQKRRDARRHLLAGISENIARGEPVEAVLTRAAAGLGQLLDAASCEFSEIDPTGGMLSIATSWRREGDPLRGRHPLDAIFLGEFRAALHAGEPVAVSDAQLDPRVDAARYAELGIRAFAIVPFVRDGEWRFAASATDKLPHDWSDDAIRLLRGVAARVFPHLERDRHVEALRRSEERFRHMADSVPHLVWIASQDGELEFLNRQWIDYTGLSIGVHGPPALADLVHPDDLMATGAAFDAARRSGEAFAVEHRMRSRDGEYRWFLVRGEPSRDPATGEVVRWFGTSVDIHDLKMAQQALADDDRRKDEFLAMLAHELRNPLAPIATAAHLLEHVAHDAPRVLDVAHIINRQVGHIRDLVDDLLDVSRVTRGLITLRDETHDVATIVAGAVEQSRAELEARGHLLQVTLPETALRVRGDRTRLIQVLANLLNNAVKYSPEGSRIDIDVSAADGQACMVVADTGQGIDAALLPHVFELFAQGKRSPDRAHGGLGLGLALVRHLVQLHGGRVEAQSEGVGRGSRFVVRLPAVEGMSCETHEHARPAVTVRPLHVVVVDDNQDAADTLALTLSLAGHTVEVHADARSALDRDGDVTPDVFLLDIGLPGMDGRALAGELRRDPQLARCRFIAISGYGSAADVAESRQAGFDQHLVKPVDLHALLQLLATSR